MALGEFRSNFGAGMGFQGLSGVMALALDMASMTHSGLPRHQNLRVALYGSNPSTNLLSTVLAQNVQPANFAVRAD